MSILAPPDVWDAYADLFDLGDGEVIAGRLERLGWRRRPSYGFTGPSAAVTIMSSAIPDSELWLDIRGPKPHLVRAALDPLGVERLAEEVGQEGHTSQRTVSDVTASTRMYIVKCSCPARTPASWWLHVTHQQVLHYVMFSTLTA
jgi:hypothetical protein